MSIRLTCLVVVLCCASVISHMASRGYHVAGLRCQYLCVLEVACPSSLPYKTQVSQEKYSMATVPWRPMRRLQCVCSAHRASPMGML